MSWFRKVRKGEVGDTALEEFRAQNSSFGPCPYLDQQLPQCDIKTHQVSRVRVKNLGIFLTDIFRSSRHSRFDRLARSIHKQFSEPLEHHLNLMRVGLYKIIWSELNTDVPDTSCNLSIRLLKCISIWKMLGWPRSLHTRRMKASPSFFSFLPRPLSLLTVLD